MPIHQIDVATGAVAFDQPDVGLPGVLPLSFVRHYSTANLLRQTSLGPGWSHSFDHRLQKTIEGWQYTDERGVSTQIIGRFSGQIELVEKGREIWLRRYTSGNPRLWYVFKEYGGTHRLWRLQLTETQAIALFYDKGDPTRLTSVEHHRSGRRLEFAYLSESDGVAQPCVGLLASVTVVFADSYETVASYLRDDKGRIIAVYDVMGSRATFEYDEWNCIAQEKKCSGSVYTFKYDARCRCVHAWGTGGFEERFLSYDDNRRQTTVTDRDGNAWIYVCNAHGQVLTETTPDGAKTKRTYDNRGLLVSTVGPLGNRTDRTYDQLGRLREIIDGKRRWILGYDDDTHLLVDIRIPTGKQWIYNYDERGFLARSVGPHGARWSYVYNEHGELQTVVDPAGGSAVRVHDEFGNVVRTMASGRVRCFEYDRWGRAVAQIDADGVRTERTYDKGGRLVQIRTSTGVELDYVYDDGGHVIERRGPGGTFRASWLPCGCMTELQRPDGSIVSFTWGNEPGELLMVRDGARKAIRFEYDAMGRMRRRVHYDGAVIDIEYDLAGNPTAVTDGHGRRFEATFDLHNNLVAYSSPSSTTTYAYDILDRLISAERGSTKLMFVRDAYGRITKEEFSFGDDVVVRRRILDKLGRPEHLMIRDEQTRYADASWNWDGAYVGEIVSGSDAWSFEYDAMGRIQSRTTARGDLRQSYDADGRITRQVVGTSYLATYDYVDGHIAKISDRTSEQTFIVGELDRLISWCHRNFDGQFRIERNYDPAGNLAEESLVVGEEAHRHAGELHGNQTLQIWDPHRDEVVQYEYDTLGRVSRIDSPKSTTMLSWSDEGWLVAAEVDGARWTYDYDPFGRRVRKTAPDGRSWRYFWDDARLAAIAGSGGERCCYVYDPYGHIPIAIRHGDGQTYDLLARPQGTPAVAITEDKVLPLHEHLDPWLRPIGEVVAPKRLGMPGNEGFVGSPGSFFDPETGFYYNLHRYYDPTSQKFLTPDPCGLLGGLNEYAWVPNPAEWIDPLGLRYANGGPFPWRPGENARNGPAPNLTDPSNRNVAVMNPETGAIGDRRAADRKCLTVVDGIPDSALPVDRGFVPGDSAAFVSGHGHPEKTPKPDFDVRMDQMGNWCHGEIQALHFLVQNDISGATVWVDRPPCGMCAGDLDAILDAHFPGGDGRSVTVMYPDPEGGWETWDELKKRTQPPCGG